MIYQLKSLTSTVDDVDVIDFQAHCPSTDSSSSIISLDIVAAHSANDSHTIGGVRGDVVCISVNSQLSSTGCNIHLLIVCPRVDKDLLGSSGSCGESIHGRLNL